jgi:hypothetical protein
MISRQDILELVVGRNGAEHKIALALGLGFGNQQVSSGDFCR